METMLKDKVAIITGSGRGIGRETALLFAREGAKVVVSDIDPQPAEETVEAIRSQGGQAIAFTGDVTDPAFADGIAKAAGDEYGNIHILVNNAGFTWDGLIHKMTDEQWDKILDLHLKGPFRLIKAVKPYFCDVARQEQRENGAAEFRKIVNVSSIAGLGGNVGQINYSSAKAGLVGLTKTVSKEWARFNVQTNCVAFGFIDTRLTQEKEKGLSLETDGQTVALGVPKKQRDIFNQMIPMGRPGTPKEAAGAILLFASPLANYVSGQVLVVGGGFSM